MDTAHLSGNAVAIDLAGPFSGQPRRSSVDMSILADMPLHVVPVERGSIWRAYSGRVVKIVAAVVAPSLTIGEAPRMWAVTGTGEWLNCRPHDAEDDPNQHGAIIV